MKQSPEQEPKNLSTKLGKMLTIMQSIASITYAKRSSVQRIVQ